MPRHHPRNVEVIGSRDPVGGFELQIDLQLIVSYILPSPAAMSEKGGSRVQSYLIKGKHAN